MTEQEIRQGIENLKILIAPIRSRQHDIRQKVMELKRAGILHQMIDGDSLRSEFESNERRIEELEKWLTQWVSMLPVPPLVFRDGQMLSSMDTLKDAGLC